MFIAFFGTFLKAFDHGKAKNEIVVGRKVGDFVVDVLVAQPAQFENEPFHHERVTVLPILERLFEYGQILFVGQFSENEDNTQFTLCVDETWSGCNRESRGESLFDKEGEQTPYLGKVLEFLEDYQKRFHRTQAYCKKLVELKLLESMKADVTYGSGKTRTLTGFMVVNREKLKDLSPDQLAELARTDELELTYLHLHSMNNFPKILDRANESQARQQATES